ncbi:nucleotidyltransferase and HEPN domain-containing protein [Brevundimonas goettingensis]|uniref:HEPN domain-containing protein n=1 Tax=Brevundimonas goettingensis TaxID=2774190 RepID=A0A975C1Y8_9CAUL|nr:nucleotidyltransferase and HEPN domain-containing protein [Brevundimonas goettingensis]QTC90330.1 HEPN domain-containing protein [Brevundimonas goettingensis]
MKRDIDHLPDKQQAELARIRTTLLTEFDASIAGGTQTWRKHGKILKIILFGSYARNDWVDEPENGYLSDFDLLIIVSNEKLTDIADYWYVAEDKILHDAAIGRTVNIIVHDLAEVNAAIGRGEYFWTDIVRDGVVLYELPGHPLATPQPLSRIDALAMADRYFAAKQVDLNSWLEDAERWLERSAEGVHARKRAAFHLHQAVETAYICILLVHTFYFPRSHNIKFLRSLAEDVDKTLVQAWPRATKHDRRLFETLKRAYVEARYSDQYDLPEHELRALYDAAQGLAVLVERSSKARLAAIRAVDA